MNRSLALILSLVFLASVSAEESPPKDTKAASEYFPRITFSKDEYIQSFFVDWYSGILALMGEKPLLQNKRKSERVIYRFTCIRTFHRPFCIRIGTSKDEKQLDLRVLSGQGGFAPGKLEKSKSITLTDAALHAVEKALTDSKFRKMEPVQGDLARVDGSQWIIEVVSDGKYKLVDRFSPKKDSPIYKLGGLFLQLSKWKPKELY